MSSAKQLPPFSKRLCVLRRALGLMIIFGLVAGVANAAEHRLGFGMHYWKSVNDLASDDFDLDEDGLIPVFSYQYRPGGFVFFEVDLEYFSDGFGGAVGSAYSPQAFIMVGKGLYGGVGVGVTVADDFQDNYSDPFFIGRVGWSMKVLPKISVDLNANYSSDSFSTLDQYDSDSITLGASARFSL